MCRLDPVIASLRARASTAKLEMIQLCSGIFVGERYWFPEASLSCASFNESWTRKAAPENAAFHRI